MHTTSTRRTRAIVSAVVVVLAGITAAATGPAVEARRRPGNDELAPRSGRKLDEEATRRVRADYPGLPLRFEPAAGAAAADAEFVARDAEYSLQLAKGEARVILGPTPKSVRRAITMRLVGASANPKGSGHDVLPGLTNYLIGNDPRLWRTGVRSFAKVEYRDIYPGVDIVYYGKERQLEFDFIVAPGASYRAIALAFDGSTNLSIDRGGNLLVGTGAGTLVQQAPCIYQEESGRRRPVPGTYVLAADGRVGFDIGSYDPRLPLIIDPVLTYSTYLGGSREERVGGIAFDAQGNMYVAGMTSAADFPAAAPPALSHARDGGDAFVVKFNAAGDQFLYATYIGGTGYEQPVGLAVDDDGNAYVAGQTNSSDFPVGSGIQSSLRGFSDGFVAKLDPNGVVVYSTYLGGNGEDGASGIAVDTLGRAYVSGSTISADFPTANALQASLGGQPAFRTTDGGHTWAGIGRGLLASWVRTFAIDPANTQTVYAGTAADGIFKSTDGGSTWTGTGPDLPPLATNALVVDAAGAVFVANDAGLWRSRDGGATWTMLQLWMPVASVVFDPASQILYAGASEWYPRGVFKSGDGGDTWEDTGLPEGIPIASIAVSQSVVYAGTSHGVFKTISGNSWAAASAGIQEPVTSVAVSSTNADVAYAGTNSALFYTADGGGSWSPVLPSPVMSVAVAASNPLVAYVATWYGSGMTEDGGLLWHASGPAGTNVGFFAIDPLDATRVYAGGSVGWDSFVSRISADGSRLEYSTFIGGSSSEWDTAIAVDSTGAAYVAGTTQSTDFPVLDPLQQNAGGLMDVFVAKISEAGSLVYSTYLGGWSSDYAPRIAVDRSGQAHVVGITLSLNFPTANAFQPVHGGGFYDVFVAALNASGTGLVYSTYLGGNDQEEWSQSGGPAVAIAASGEAVVAGSTRSMNFPTRDAVQPAHGGGLSDAFVASFDTAGQIVYSTYLGGTGADYGARVAVDGDGAVAVAGASNSSDLPTQHPIQSANAGAEDVFIARIASGTPPADTTAPTTTVNLAGTAGTDDWFKSSVTVMLRTSDGDDGTGVAFVEYSLNGGSWQRYTEPFVITTQGTTGVRARATDRAGNVENPGASSTFRIDSVGPAIAVTSPRATEYLHTVSLQVSFGATDSLSGLAAAAATLDGVAVANGQTIQLLTLPLGAHTFSVSAADRTGNTSTVHVVFTVVATIDTLMAAVNMFIAEGQIDASLRRSLLAKLEDAKQLLARGNLTGAAGKLDDFKNHVVAQTHKAITPTAAQVLIADANSVIGTLQ